MKRVGAVLLALGMLVSSAGADSTRFKSYIKWCQHYQRLMGIEDKTYTYIHYHHESWCAWVSAPNIPGFDVPINVGLSEPDWECLTVPVKKLALHEMCHIRMQHIFIPDGVLNSKKKHQEVWQCMKDYEERDRDE